MQASYDDEGNSGFVDAEASGGRSQDIETQEHLLLEPASLIAARAVARITLEEAKANARLHLDSFAARPVSPLSLCCRDFYEGIIFDAKQGGREAMARVRTKLLVEPVELCMSRTVILDVMSNANLPLVKCYIEALPRRRTDFAGLVYFDTCMETMYNNDDQRRREITRVVRKMRVADIRTALQERHNVHADASCLSQTKPKLIKLLVRKRRSREIQDRESVIVQQMQLEGRHELATVGMYTQEQEFRKKWKAEWKFQKDGRKDIDANGGASKKRKRAKETAPEGTAVATASAAGAGINPELLLKWGKYMDKYLTPLRSFCTRAGELLEEQGRYREAITYYERSSRISFDKGIADHPAPSAITMDHLLLVSNTIDYANDVSNIALAQKHMEDYTQAHKYYKFAMNVLARLVLASHEFKNPAKAATASAGAAKNRQKKKRRRKVATKGSAAAAAAAAAESGGGGGDVKSSSGEGGGEAGSDEAADQNPSDECVNKLTDLCGVREHVMCNIRRNWMRELCPLFVGCCLRLLLSWLEHMLRVSFPTTQAPHLLTLILYFHTHVLTTTTGLHDELTNWSGTSGEYDDLKREYENGPAFWRSNVAVAPAFRRGLSTLTFHGEMM